MKVLFLMVILSFVTVSFSLLLHSLLVRNKLKRLENLFKEGFDMKVIEPKKGQVSKITCGESLTRIEREFLKTVVRYDLTDEEVESLAQHLVESVALLRFFKEVMTDGSQAETEV